MAANEATGVQTTIRTTDRPLFALYHPPIGPAHDVAVVMCPPLGYEALTVYRTYRHAAERLAREGFAVIRFDYFGTGNSSGDTVEAHDPVADVHAAIDHVKQLAAVTRVCLFGVRAGALLSAAVAVQREDIAGLVLLAAPTSGRTLVRELRAFYAMSSADASSDDQIDIAGFAFPQRLLNELESINLLKLDFSPIERILLFGRDDLPDDGKLFKYCSAAGCMVRQVKVKGYAVMMTTPESSLVPERLLEHFVAWMQVMPSVCTSEVAHNKAAVDTRLVCCQGDVMLEEQAVRCGPQQRLFGIVTQSRQAVPSPHRRAVLLLSVGANHHIGSGRLYVSMARELAATGLVVLRFDISGLGESYAEPGKDENVIYDPDSVADVTHAMEFLSKTHGVDEFILTGICFGAHLAFYSPPTRHRVVGSLLINWAVFELQPPVSALAKPQKSFKSRQSYVSAVFDRSTWRRLLQGEVALFSIAVHLSSQTWRLAMSALKARLFSWLGVRVAVNPVERDMKALLHKGIPVWLVYSDGDPALDGLKVYLGADAGRVASFSCFHMQRVQGADHAFSRPVAQQAVRKIMMDFLASLDSGEHHVGNVAVG